MSNLKQGIQKVKKIDYLPLIFAYAVIIIFFSVCSPYFLSFTNFMSIILYASIVGILSLTTCLVLAAGQIDFSAGSVIALGSCVMGIMMRGGSSVWAAMAVCMLISALTGVYNGIMIAYL